MEELLVQAAIAAAKTAQTADGDTVCTHLCSVWHWTYWSSWAVGVLGSIVLLARRTRKKA